MTFYKSCLFPLFERFDPERVHDVILHSSQLGRPWFKLLNRLFSVSDPKKKLRISLNGLQFENPIGLAAGFDKQGRAVEMFACFGFSHLELGTVTSAPQAGNPKPRIFRYVEDRALINRMGFPSEGADSLADKVKSLSSKRPQLPILGINIGKLKAALLEEALADYQKTFSTVLPYADYITINVSSPNTPELRKLQEPERLKELFLGLQESNDRKIPLFVKLAPDIERGEFTAVLNLLMELKISGVIATNTTIGREGLTGTTEEVGGLSGRPLFKKSHDTIQFIHDFTGGTLPIIGSGGVFSAKDALLHMIAGASLVQIYTGLVYEGPGIVKQIVQGMLNYCDVTGLDSVTELIGKPEFRESVMKIEY